MFYTAEDVNPAVAAATEVFGKVGSMLEGKNVLYNITIATREYGKLWYGDLEMSTEELHNKCKTLGQKIGQKVYFLKDGQFDELYAQSTDLFVLLVQWYL